MSIINFYGGEATLERLRILSGSNISGTTLLGLFQASIQSGFDTDACEANLASLIQHNRPCILHVLINHMEHYVVCYETIKYKDELTFIIGDPARGIIHVSVNELSEMWHSKACLILSPNSKFISKKELKHRKIDWVISTIKKDNPLLFIAAGIGIITVILNLTMTIFTQHLIDDILPKKNIKKLNIGVAMALILLVSKEILTVIRQYFLLYQSKEFNIRMTDFFFGHLLRLPKPFFDTRKIGDLTSRLKDTTRIQMIITQLFGNAIIDILVAIIAAFVIFIYSWQLGIISLIVIPTFYSFVHLHKNTIQKKQRSIMSDYSFSESSYISTLQGIEGIKVHNKIPLFTKENKHRYNIYQKAIFSLGKVQLKLAFLVNTFSILLLLGILLWGSHRVLNDQMKTGVLIAIVGMYSSLIASIANLALLSIPISEAKIAIDRMFEFTGIESESESSGYQIDTFESLSVRNITFRFAGRSLLLKDVSFDLRKGDIIGLMGENGSGKTTITQLLQKHLNWESGLITVNEIWSLKDISLSSWRQLISIVPQQVFIFNGTILENIAFEEALSNTQEVLMFLHTYGFTTFIDDLPQSYMTIVGEEGISLSGGQKQIIALARALYCKPKLLILDEASASMDRYSEQFLLKVLNRTRKDMGIIFITHRLHILKNTCDRIYILGNGNIVDKGTHCSLLKTENLYSRNWHDLMENSQ